MVIRLTPGQVGDSTQFAALMNTGVVPRRGRGRPKLRPKRVVADKGYSSGSIRAFLRSKGIRVTIPRKSNERRRGSFDKAAYRERNRVERCFNRLKQYRRIATRYEKMAENYLAMVLIGAILMWL
jgi:transposase